MIQITSQPFYTVVMGVEAPYSGFLRIFVPQGSLGYLGKEGCGCCGNGGCKDPRIILEFAEGVLVHAYAFAGGSRKEILISSAGIQLDALINAPVQYLPGTLSLDSESECPCNPSERWTARSDVTNFDELNRNASRSNPYTTISTLQGTLLSTQGELEDLRQENDNLKLVRDILTDEKQMLQNKVEALTEELSLCRLRSNPAFPLGEGESPALPEAGSASQVHESMVALAFGDCFAP